MNSFADYLSRPQLRRQTIMAATLFAMIAFPSAARCEYLLHAGDIISISTIGSDDLKQQSMIQSDGDVSLPLVGEVKAAGLSITQLREHVLSILGTKVLRRRTPSGQEFPIVISPTQLYLAIVQYSPVYVMGDVAKPGSEIYRPGITVRQAIALAGGYDIAGFRMQNPFLQSADLRAEYESLWTEFARLQADALRMKTELANGTDLDQKLILSLPISPSLSKRIISLEQNLLTTRNEDKEKEIAGLKDGIAQENKRLATLGDLETKETEGNQADQKEYQRVKGLFDRGSVPITRVSAMRRQVLSSATGILQTTVQRYGVERQKHVLSLQLQSFHDQRKIKLLNELKLTELQLGKIRPLIQATAEKLTYTSMVKSQLTSGKGSKPDLVIHRSDGTDESVNDDSKMQPGDVLEVRLHLAPLTIPAAEMTSR